MRGAHDAGGAGGAGGAGLLVVAKGFGAVVVGGAVVEAGAEDVPTEEGVATVGGEEQATANVAAATRTAVGRVRW